MYRSVLDLNSSNELSSTTSFETGFSAIHTLMSQSAEIVLHVSGRPLQASVSSLLRFKHHWRSHELDGLVSQDLHSPLIGFAFARRDRLTGIWLVHADHLCLSSNMAGECFVGEWFSIGRGSLVPSTRYWGLCFFWVLGLIQQIQSFSADALSQLSKR